MKKSFFLQKIPLFSDVDASGEVTIADVTTLIDYLLSR